MQYAGYMITFQCKLPLPPEAKFEANKEITCTGMVEFTDNSINEPDEWLWDFGDGETSDLQNPVHQYAQNGTYTVSLTVTNEFGTNTIEKENLITVEFPEAPVIKDTTVCTGLPFEIVLDLKGTAYWYENITDEEPVYIGNIWEYPEINDPQLITYFVQQLIENPDADELCISPFTEFHILAEICEGIHQNYMENVKIAPNPTTGELTIDNGQLTIDNIEIFDVYGRKLLSNHLIVSSSHHLINISELSAGVYFVKISTKIGEVVKKVVKL